jgi:hypothetical protein
VCVCVCVCVIGVLDINKIHFWMNAKETQVHGNANR